MLSLIQYAMLTEVGQHDPSLLDAYACALSEEASGEAQLSRLRTGQA